MKSLEITVPAAMNNNDATHPLNTDPIQGRSLNLDAAIDSAPAANELIFVPCCSQYAVKIGSILFSVFSVDASVAVA